MTRAAFLLHPPAPAFLLPGYRYSWQECGVCKGAFVLWRNPNEPLPTGDERFDPTRTWWHLDGRPVKASEIPICDTCGANAGWVKGPFRSHRRRWGDRRPEPSVPWVVRSEAK